MATEGKNHNSSSVSVNAVSDNVVLILDFGSQYTHLITRRIRQLAVCSVCLSGTSPLSAMAALNPSVIILSGGPHSVHEEGAPLLPDGFFDYVWEKGIHVLGICYGLQLIVKMMGGKVKPAESQEYGRMEVCVHEGFEEESWVLEPVGDGRMEHLPDRACDQLLPSVPFAGFIQRSASYAAVQAAEMEIMKLPSERVRLLLAEKTQMHLRALQCVVAENVASRLSEKEIQIMSMKRRNVELEEQIKRLEVESGQI